MLGAQLCGLAWNDSQALTSPEVPPTFPQASTITKFSSKQNNLSTELRPRCKYQMPQVFLYLGLN